MLSLYCTEYMSHVVTVLHRAHVTCCNCTLYYTGAAQLTKKLQARSALEKNLRAASETLQGVGKRVHSSLVLEDWNVSSCDTIIRFLEVTI